MRIFVGYSAQDTDLPNNNKPNNKPNCPKMGRNTVKTARIYMKLYMSVFIRQNFSHPPKVFLSETLYGELPKNLVICFKGTLASLLLDTTKALHSCLILLDFKQRNLPQLLKLQITETTFNHPKTSAIIINQPSPLKTTHSQPESSQNQL